MGSGWVVGCLLPRSCPMTLYKGSFESMGGRGSGAVGGVEDGGGEGGGEEDGGGGGGVGPPLPLGGSLRSMGCGPIPILMLTSSGRGP